VRRHMTENMDGQEEEPTVEPGLETPDQPMEEPEASPAERAVEGQAEEPTAEAGGILGRLTAVIETLPWAHRLLKGTPREGWALDPEAAARRGEHEARRRQTIIGGVVAAVLIAVVLRVLVFPSPHGGPIDLTVPRGIPLSKLAKTMAENHIVPNAFVLKVWIAVSGSAGRILPGDYRFRSGTPYGQVVSDLRKGTNIPTAKVIIPEGFNVRQIAKRLGKQAGLDAAKFETMAFTGAKAKVSKYKFLGTDTSSSLEGFLFPKTYMIRYDATEADVLDRMVAQFGKDTGGLPWSRAKAMGFTPYQILTVASLVEKETFRAAERRRIAGVIYNRLRDGVPTGFKNQRLRRLQIDATVLYALGRDSGPLKAADYRLPAKKYPHLKYNTYVYEGLPPGPICNPGVATIYAALVPETNDYYFYVAKGDGSHEFATTFEEFKAVKQRLGYGR
jgi:UPF0755 protein